MRNLNYKKNLKNFESVIAAGSSIRSFAIVALRDLEMAVRLNMPQMLERYPVTGWVRPQNTQALHDEIDQLKAKVAQLERDVGDSVRLIHS